MKLLPIESCQECPFRLATPYPTSDSWERADYWWCIHPKSGDNQAMDEKGEEVRKSLKGTPKTEVVSYIAGYVEWNDETPIPEFCPLEDKE